MRTRTKLFAVALLMLGGCAAPQKIMLVHPTADESQYQRDINQCNYEVMAATANYGMGPTAPTYAGAIAQGLAEGSQMSARRRELGLACMRARGYTPTT